MDGPLNFAKEFNPGKPVEPAQLFFTIVKIGPFIKKVKSLSQVSKHLPSGIPKGYRVTGKPQLAGKLTLHVFAARPISPNFVINLADQFHLA